MSQVDVVVPCYNYAHYLERCVHSALNQRDVSVRVLIIDDCSPDNTQQIGEALAAADPRVEYRRHEVNRRHIATYNEGIEWLRGDYFVLLSADDMLVPHALTSVIEFMDAHPNVGLAYGNAVKFWDTVPEVDGSHIAYSFSVVPGDSFVADVCKTCENPISSPAGAVVRTDAQLKVGPYNAALPHSGDLEMWLRFAAIADVAICKEPVGLYRQHDSNMSTGYTRRPLSQLEQHRLTFATFFEGSGASVPQASALWTSMKNTLAWRAFWAAAKAFESGDLAEMSELLAFATKLDSSIATSSAWRRLSFKRAIGPRFWRTLSPLLGVSRAGK